MPHCYPLPHIRHHLVPVSTKDLGMQPSVLRIPSCLRTGEMKVDGYPDFVTRCYGTRDPDSAYDAAHCESTASRKLQSFRPCLFMMKAEPCSIGISSHMIREDDVLIQFINCDVAAIMRPDGQNFKFVGRAFLAKLWDEPEQKVSAKSPEVFKFSVPKCKDIRKKDRIYIWVETETLQALTCQATGGKRD